MATTAVRRTTFEDIWPREDVKTLKQLALIVAQPDIKQILVRLVVARVLRVTDLVRNLFKHKPLYKHLDEEYCSVFEWSLVHFKRRMKSRVHGIDALLDLEHPKTLAMAKIVTDLDNLDSILKQLYDGKPEYALLTLQGCQKLLEIRDVVAAAHLANTKYLRRIKFRYDTFDSYEISQMRDMDFKLNAVQDFGQAQELVGDPITMRYQRNITKSHYEIERTVVKLALKAGNKHRHDLEQEFLRNKLVSEITYQVYSMKCHDLREEIYYWEAKYDYEYEKVCSALDFHQTSIQAMTVRLEQCRTNLIYYRQYNAEKRARDEQERLERVETARVQALAAAEALEKKNKAWAKKKRMEELKQQKKKK